MLSRDDRLHLIGRLTQDGWLARAVVTEGAGIIGVPPLTPPCHLTSPLPAPTHTPHPTTPDEDTCARYSCSCSCAVLHTLGRPAGVHAESVTKLQSQWFRQQAGRDADCFR